MPATTSPTNSLRILPMTMSVGLAQYEVSTDEPATFLLTSRDESLNEVTRSKMSIRGRTAALTVLLSVRSRGNTFEDVAPAPDGGMVLEFVGRTSAREIEFLVPDDGQVRYFVARDPRIGFREAGIVLTQRGVDTLARWVTSSTSALTDSGLEFG